MPTECSIPLPLNLASLLLPVLINFRLLHGRQVLERDSVWQGRIGVGLWVGGVRLRRLGEGRCGLHGRV